MSPEHVHVNPHASAHTEQRYQSSELFHVNHHGDHINPSLYYISGTESFYTAYIVHLILMRTLRQISSFHFFCMKKLSSVMVPAEGRGSSGSEFCLSLRLQSGQPSMDPVFLSLENQHETCPNSHRWHEFETSLSHQNHRLFRKLNIVNSLNFVNSSAFKINCNQFLIQT